MSPISRRLAEEFREYDDSAEALGRLWKESITLQLKINESPIDQDTFERLDAWGTCVDDAINASSRQDLHVILAELLERIQGDSPTDTLARFQARLEAIPTVREILEDKKLRLRLMTEEAERSQSTIYGEYEVKPTGEVLLNGTELVGLKKQTKKLLIAFLGDRNRILSIPDIKRLLWNDEDRPREGDNKLVVGAINKLRTALRIEEDRTDKIKPVPNTEAYMLTTIHPDTPD